MSPTIGADALPCLSVRQPWADLIVSGVKDVENRTWPSTLRGPLLIHAPKTVEWDAVEALGDWLSPSELESWRGQRTVGQQTLGEETLGQYDPVTSAIVGWAEMVDCVTSHPSRFFSGPYGFVLRHSKRFAEPVPYRGQRGIFQVPAGTVGPAAFE